jgi:hypothetical protein
MVICDFMALVITGLNLWAWILRRMITSGALITPRALITPWIIFKHRITRHYRVL